MLTRTTFKEGRFYCKDVGQRESQRSFKVQSEVFDQIKSKRMIYAKSGYGNDARWGTLMSRYHDLYAALVTLTRV